MINVSIVNYYNTLPFRWALKNNSLAASFHLQEDMPSICAQKLKFKQVDLALVPVALLPELDTYQIESAYCIGAVGKVDSVKLYANVDLPNITSIVLDYQSKSSVTLTRLLAKEFWHIAPSFVAAKPGFEKEVQGSAAAVIIGDRAFEWNGVYQYEWDLSEQWQLFTGLPFVFAAWVSNGSVLPTPFMESFNKSLQHGVQHIKQAINEMPKPHQTRMNAEDYLTQKISYTLDDEKRKGMQLFLEKIKKLPAFVMG